MARGNTIALLMSGEGKTQTDKETALDAAELDLRINMNTPNWVNTEKTIEDIFDCVREEIVSKEVTRIIRRLPFETDFNGRVGAILAAYAWGVAAAPTGSTANEVWEIEVDATGGSFTFALTYDGISQTITVPVTGLTAVKLKYFLEEMDAIGFGNTTVSLLGNVYTVTLVGKRAGGNITLPVIDDTNATGGGAAVTLTSITEGSQRLHNITELPSGEYQPPYTSFGICFEDEDGSERIMVGATVNDLTFNAPPNGGKITIAGNIISRDLVLAPGLVVPECVVYRAARTSDCLFTRNSVDYTNLLKEFALSYNNNILTGNSAFTGRSVKMSRQERASQRTRQLTYGLLGGVTPEIYQEAEANPEADIKRAYSVRIGVEGDSLTVSIPNGLTELNTGGGIDFDGESEEAIERFVTTPTKQGSTLPTAVAARVPIAVQLLQT
jgi:hypothetical protein